MIPSVQYIMTLFFINYVTIRYFVILKIIVFSKKQLNDKQL